MARLGSDTDSVAFVIFGNHHGGVVAVPRVFLCGYINAIAFAEFLLAPILQFFFRESLLVSLDASVRAKHKYFRRIVERDARDTFNALLADAVRTAHVDEHLAARLQFVGHVVKHVGTPV